LYITTNCLLFYSKLPTKEKRKASLLDLDVIEKKKTAVVIPNAMRIKTKQGEDYLFVSFMSRDKAYDAIQQQIILSKKFLYNKKKKDEAHTVKKQVAEVVDREHKMSNIFNAMNKIQPLDMDDEPEEPLPMKQKSRCAAYCVLV